MYYLIIQIGIWSNKNYQVVEGNNNKKEENDPDNNPLFLYTNTSFVVEHNDDVNYSYISNGVIPAYTIYRAHAL